MGYNQYNTCEKCGGLFDIFHHKNFIKRFNDYAMNGYPIEMIEYKCPYCKKVDTCID